MSCDCPIQETPADYQQAERLYREGQWRSAEALCRGLLTQDAGHADALNLLGLLARKARKEHEAAGYFARAITRNPSRAAFYSNLGLSFVQTNDLDRAEESFRLALRLEPGNPDFQSNLGLVRFQSGEYGSAASIYRGVLAHQPDHACAHWNLSLVLLLLEDYEQGWKEYEWRLLLENYHGDLARMTRPLWRGEAFQGRSLFVWCEQGHGDTLQFVRYLPLVKGLGGRVILSCQPPLFRLMQTLRGVDQLVANSDPVPEHDLQVPLLSLPRIFGTDAHHIPSQVPYLDATSGIQARILAEGRHLKVGLVWAGDPQHPNDHNRSLRLGQFEPLLELPGATFYSLQVGARAQELENLPAPKRPMDLSPQLQDFADTANVLIQLDLLITADTAVAHLAGALGKPAWVLLPRVPDWRWLLNREDSPWYPSLRLYRQSVSGDWDPVIRRVRGDLALLLRRRDAGTPGRISAAPSDSHHDGVSLIDMGLQALRKQNHEQALGFFKKAVERSPMSFAAHYNLALCFQESGRLNDAVESYRRALAIEPRSWEARENLGVALGELGEIHEALILLSGVVQDRPNSASAHNNLARVLRADGQLAQAEDHLRTALMLQGDSPPLMSNYASLLRELGRPQEAIDFYQQALLRAPDSAEIHWNLAFALLLLGQWNRGWEEYEWRWKRGDFAQRSRVFRSPAWRGETLEGKRLLVHAEQGLGDTLQFCRYVPHLIQAGAEVILECQPSLTELMCSLLGDSDTLPSGDGRSFPGGGGLVVVAQGAAVPEYDLHVPLLSLPRLFRTTLDTVPAEAPYLHVPKRNAKWQEVSSLPGLKVGLAWAGNISFANQRNRSLSLDQLCPLLELPNVQFVSLQVGPAVLELGRNGACHRIQEYGSRLRDFSDTAALISRLDLVISVDTAVAHLAGAMAKPVWTLLPYAAEWRWLLERKDSPWYPTMRLFRQPAPRDWTSVVGSVAHELLKRTRCVGRGVCGSAHA